MDDLPFDCFPDVERHGPTFDELMREHPAPVFFAETSNVLERFGRLRASLQECWRPNAIAYSFKTSYPLAESRILKRAGAWAEVVSGREYALAGKLGYRGGEVVFNGPYKTDAQLLQAFDDGATVNVNDADELERVLRIAARREGPTVIGIRVKTEAAGLGRSRFGFSLDDGEASTAVDRALSSPALRLAGLHMHLLGDTDDPDCYRNANARLAEFLHASLPDGGASLSYLDLGGGFPAHGPRPYRKETWDPRPIETYVEAMTEPYATFFDPERRPLLIVEPGRYLVGDSAVFISKIVRLEIDAGTRVIVSNASITMVPLTHYSPQAIRAFSQRWERRGGAERESRIVGVSCREDDILWSGSFPEVQPGDWLVHYAVGAYNWNFSPGFIFEVPPLVFF